MTFLGHAKDALALMADPESIREHQAAGHPLDPELGPGAVVADARLAGEPVLFLANDAQQINPRFRVVYGGVIGLEEAYKFALAVYHTIEQDADQPPAAKRPLVLIIDTPGNGPGKLEEILGMNKATGGYQLALAEARKAGHPVVAVIVGRAISGGFLCHGLQADRILALGPEYGTMVHVMPLTSIARIIKVPLERLEALAQTNPVFAAGVDFFYNLGGVDELIPAPEAMREVVLRQIQEVRRLKAEGRWEELGPPGRGRLGAERGGRRARAEVMAQLEAEAEPVLAELRPQGPARPAQAEKR